MPDLLGHGYQVLRGVIDVGVARRIHTFLEQEAQSTLRALRTELRAADDAALCRRIDEVYADGRAGHLSRELQLTLTGHFPLSTRLSPRLWEIPKLALVRRALEQALQHRRLYMHMPPTARFVLPGNARAAVPAHRDVSYNRHMSDFVVLWVPLTPIDERCGGVAIYEGSERDSVDEASGSGFWLGAAAVSGRKRIHPHLNVGDALLMSRMIIHESVPNDSGRIRYSIDFRFMNEAHTSTKHVLDMQRWCVVDPGGKLQPGPPPPAGA